MTKNLQVRDPKPQNVPVRDPKPQNMNLAVDFGTEQVFTVVFNAGQSMGLLLALTYTTGGTVQSPITN